MVRRFIRHQRAVFCSPVFAAAIRYLARVHLTFQDGPRPSASELIVHTTMRQPSIATESLAHVPNAANDPCEISITRRESVSAYGGAATGYVVQRSVEPSSRTVLAWSPIRFCNALAGELHLFGTCAPPFGKPSARLTANLSFGLGIVQLPGDFSAALFELAMRLSRNIVEIETRQTARRAILLQLMLRRAVLGSLPWTAFYDVP